MLESVETANSQNISDKELCILYITVVFEMFNVKMSRYLKLNKDS